MSVRYVSRRVLAVALLLLVLAVFGAVFLYFIGIDALEGRNEFQFFADSGTYHEAARGDLLHITGVADAISVGANYLGPLLVLNLVGQGYYLALLLNVAIMFVALRSLARSVEADALRLLLLLLLNPLTLSSILSVNKEIISVVFVALLVRAYVGRSVPAFLVALGVSILVRWQLTLFALILFGIIGPWNPLRQHRWLTLAALLVVLSIMYVALAPVLEPIQLNFDLAAAEYEGSGFFQWLVELQSRGWYWLVFIMKAAHLLFGSGLRMDRLFNPTNIYNDVWQLLHSTALLVLFLALWLTGRLRLRNDLVYLSAIYIAVFATTPIYGPRYFYPVYLLWALALLARQRFPVVFTALGRGGAKRQSPLGTPATHMRA